MGFSQIGKAGLFSLAIAPIVGTSINFGDSQWSMFIGLAVILLVAGIVVGRQMTRSRSRYRYSVPEPRPAGDKLSGQLVALSSAAIIAVYSAGYFRTNAAAHQFAAHSVELDVPPSVATGGLAPETPSHAAANAGISSPVSSPVGPAGRVTQTDKSVASIPSSTTASISTLRSGAATSGASVAPSSKSHAAEPVSGKHSVEAAANTAASGAQPDAGATPAPPPSPYKDGVYAGRGSCPHGDIQAQVVVASGLIVSADITRCETRYPCSLLDREADDVVYAQGNVVDMVTGATESAYAFHEAIAQALAQAMSSQAK
jgi:uncharacterized protein with FMN-binding domain